MRHYMLPLSSHWCLPAWQPWLLCIAGSMWSLWLYTWLLLLFSLLHLIFNSHFTGIRNISSQKYHNLGTFSATFLTTTIRWLCSKISDIVVVDFLGCHTCLLYMSTVYELCQQQPLILAYRHYSISNNYKNSVLWFCDGWKPPGDRMHPVKRVQHITPVKTTMCTFCMIWTNNILHIFVLYFFRALFATCTSRQRKNRTVKSLWW